MEDNFVYVLMVPEQVPERWSGRARSLSLVPLDPDEASQVLSKGSATPSMSQEEESVAKLVARGHSARAIAQALHMTERSVYRRLARLRKRAGVETTAQLAAQLAHQGF
jgi:DNA-binding CsgD family transcriptional regulator